MSDTPETDAAEEAHAAYKQACHDSDSGMLSAKPDHGTPDGWAFARKLERECEEYENRLATGIHSCHPECQRPMCVLRRERDEATEALYDMTCQHWCGCGHPACNRCADDTINKDLLQRMGRKNGPWNAFGE